MNQIFARRLKSARLMRELSMEQLSEKLNKIITKQSISKYEKGLMFPNSTILIELSKALNVSIDFFFRPYKINISDIEFRKKSKLSVTSLKGIKENVLDRIEKYLEIENILNIENPFDAKFQDDPISSAEDVKNMAHNVRKHWKLGEDAINNVISTLEDNGIKLIQLDYNLKFDGLSGYVNKNYPVIIINKNVSPERQRFTALHELGHLILSFQSSIMGKEKEKFCNLFASEMLIPSSQFIKLIGNKKKDISLQELTPIQIQYGISIDALMYKAKELNIITESRFKGYCIKKNTSNEFKEKVTKSHYPYEESDRFNSIVYRAISKEIISFSKAASLLGRSVNDVRSSVNFI